MTDARGQAEAGLFMYALPELEKPLRCWWRVLGAALNKQGLEELPSRLSVPQDPLAHWLAPNLVLSQTCGYPLTHDLRGRVTYLATPCYDAVGSAGPTYRSVFIVARDSGYEKLADLRGRRVVINDWNSQSGMNCLRAAIAPLAKRAGFFSSVELSGGHGESLAWVAERRADLAAIDGVTFALFQRHRPGLTDRLKVIGLSDPAPGLPYITGLACPPARRRQLRAGLLEAFAAPDGQAARQALLLRGCELLAPSAYQVILDMEQAARDLGYPTLA
jgi:ABC-type phosphate/phosphonate transport system substrate-binding protein